MFQLGYLSGGWVTNPVEGGMSGGLEGCEEAIQVPEGQWGWHRRWRRGDRK